MKDASLPIILFVFKLLKENFYVEKYLAKPCEYLDIKVPLTLLMTLMVFHLGDFESIRHYQQYFSQTSIIFNDNFSIYCADKFRIILHAIANSMFVWKLSLLQRALVQQHASNLLKSKYGIVLDIDGTALVSYTNHREGSEFGHSNRFRGKQLLQLSASFIGNIFIDCKLFSGSTNVGNFFIKSVKRAISLGYSIDAVRADTLYGTVKNLLFLEKLSLLYALGIRTSLTKIKESCLEFTQLARQGSLRIIHIAKGVSILDLGLINVAGIYDPECLRRVILCRRIHRTKKNGKWVIKTYFYAIVSNLKTTPRKIFEFYHQRQWIENGFKELRYHYKINHFARNGKDSLKGNEFWIVSKMLAMTMYKIFTQIMLPKKLQSKRKKTLLLDLLGQCISNIRNGKVVLRSKPKHLWHIKRIFSKLDQDKFLPFPYKIVV